VQPKAAARALRSRLRRAKGSASGVGNVVGLWGWGWAGEGHACTRAWGQLSLVLTLARVLTVLPLANPQSAKVRFRVENGQIGE
jgi:hypothetical protein